MRTFKFILPFEIIVDKRRRRILILALFYKAIPDHTTASTPVWDYPTLKPFFITAQSLSTLTVAVNIQFLRLLTAFLSPNFVYGNRMSGEAHTKDVRKLKTSVDLFEGCATGGCFALSLRVRNE